MYKLQRAIDPATQVFRRAFDGIPILYLRWCVRARPVNFYIIFSPGFCYVTSRRCVIDMLDDPSGLWIFAGKRVRGLPMMMMMHNLKVFGSAPDVELPIEFYCVIVPWFASIRISGIIDVLYSDSDVRDWERNFDVSSLSHYYFFAAARFICPYQTHLSPRQLISLIRLFRSVGALYIGSRFIVDLVANRNRQALCSAPRPRRHIVLRVIVTWQLATRQRKQRSQKKREKKTFLFKLTFYFEAFHI